MWSWRQTLADTRLELAYFSGLARMAEQRAGGAGVILRFEHVRPASSAKRFQPLKSAEITPEFLDRAIAALKDWKFDCVSLDEVRARSGLSSGGRRWVALTFDGAHLDFAQFAYPALRKHDVPFALYVPTGFVDNIGVAWWLALEAVIARHPRIALVIDDEERRFRTSGLREKHQAFEFLHGWMRTLSPDNRAAAIGDLCGRYGVDLKAISRDIAMSWIDILRIAADPRATIGSATVNYPVVSTTKGTVVLRDMKMARTILEAALGRACPHFAYPFGDEGSFGPRDILLANEAGFASAVTSIPGVISERSSVMALPRIAWDGRRTSLRALRVVLSGFTARDVRAMANENDGATV